MITEGRGISDIVKDEVDKIYQLFLKNSFSSHKYLFGSDRLGHKKITINFNHINNYYSNIQIDKFDNLTLNIGIPTNGKEKRIKKNISHELTHIIEILGLGDKDYPKYNKIKISLIEFKNNPMSNAMEFITDLFYKTLDNEVNANVAQTYIYIKSDGRCSREMALKRLKEWETYKLYNSVKNLKLDLLIKNLNKEEVDRFNNLLIKNDVKTISTNNIETWLKYWFRIFKRKSDVFLKNSERILKEVEEDWSVYEQYVSSIPNDGRVIDYSPYIEKFDEFKDKPFT
jgi:hypothetical protein